MKKSLLTLLAMAMAPAAMADTLTFNFEDPKKVNNVVFILDAPLEQISGSANGITGTVSASPDNPEKISGKIVVDAKSLHVPNPLMKDHLHGEEWLDTARHDTISFEVKEVSNIQRDGNAGTADVLGTFTLRGVSKDMTIPVRVTYLPGRLKDRGGDQEGDLLVLRSNFVIKRSDFGIRPGEFEDKVSDDIQVTLNVAGAAPKS
jgi:polyisoprenoid-binding protein YceI